MKKIYFAVIAILSIQSSFALNALKFDPPFFTYGQSIYCQDSPDAIPIFSPGSNTGGVFTASPVGIVLDNTTGAINFMASVPGTYVVTYFVSGSGEEPSYAVETYVTIVGAVELQPIDDVSACAFYILPQIFEGNYYSGPNGTGTAYFAGDAILSSMEMHVFSQGQSPCMNTDDIDFMIDINTIDIGVSYDGAAFSAHEADATYQWAICSDPPVFLPEETQQYFFPTENGDYTVLISKGDCEAFASCFTVDFLGTEDNVIAGLEFGPNPFHDQVKLKSKQTLDEIAFYNVMGQLVFNQKLPSGNAQLNLSKLPNGSYFVKATAGNRIQTFKMLKN